ncbi:glutathione S-transferase [Acinetobacter bereziniae]|jgi:glutathione S-transferase|uniref:glutathione S-transferase family protein n=1 Tax=Acinetobacter TaxID=469 RepID=UPI00158119A5|nr:MULTISPECIES: glutathione S-transferase [Acinetobacter]MBJ9372365.1 glutathione S-transferase [Acinetobacter sp. TGL-Y2]MBJ9948715.1 glutathione S-transferase [Acinetobacter bereziniae]MBO3654521.1 glutathione S-transferase [Acinetobacter bereziniae]MCM8513803.1 glutathione S-transferase [Acinetobacter bereziniae]MDR3027134.1 glutathione S-transferase [Acinetobacter sp.]
MITLHHLDQSRSLRIIWALEELGLEYEIKHYKRLPTLAAPPELKAVHPLGKSPVLTDGDLTIAESAVILDYLQTTYDSKNQFKPQNPQDLMQYNYWMHYAEGSLMPYLVMTLVMTNMPKHVPFLIRPIAKKISEGVRGGFINPRLKEHSAFLEDYFSQHDYAAGEFSFADIQMSFPVIAMQQRTQNKMPQIAAYAERIQQRPAYQRAKAKSGD